MSTTITVQAAETVTLEEVKILAVRDLFKEKKIIARIEKLPKPIVLWSGDAEYAAAGNWTNETALARAVEVLALPTVPWA